MLTSTKWKWPGIVGVTVAAVVAIVPLLRSQDTRKYCQNYLTREQAQQLPSKPCGCEDRPAIEMRIDEKLHEILDYERMIQQSAQEGPPQKGFNAQYAKDKQKELVTGKIDIQGLPGFAKCIPLVCEDTAKNLCKEMREATLLHEQGHCDFLDSLPFSTQVEGVAFKISGDDAKALALFEGQGEIAARLPQVLYLTKVDSELKRKCPERVSYPGDFDAKAEKKIRLAAASNRVSSYAGTM
jgi:hypothetical protein